MSCYNLHLLPNIRCNADQAVRVETFAPKGFRISADRRALTGQQRWLLSLQNALPHCGAVALAIFCDDGAR